MRRPLGTFLSVSACLALLISVVGPTMPTQATGPGAGSLAVSGTVSLPQFPCPMPPAGGTPCTATLTSGSVVGAMAGKDAGDIPWAVELNLTNVTSTFSYIDDLAPDPPCTEGLGAGSVSFETNGSNQAAGVYGNALPVPDVVNAARGSFSFLWRRVGPVMLFSVRDVRLELFAVGQQQWKVVIDTTGTAQRSDGGGLFVPNVSPMNVPDCLTPTPKPFTATVTWDFALAATS